MKRYFRLSTICLMWYWFYMTWVLIEKSTLTILNNQQPITCSTGKDYYRLSDKIGNLNKRLDSLEMWISDTNQACQASN